MTEATKAAHLYENSSKEVREAGTNGKAPFASMNKDYARFKGFSNAKKG